MKTILLIFWLSLLVVIAGCTRYEKMPLDASAIAREITPPSTAAGPFLIRSKNAGVNRITYEIYFHSEDEYRQALDSGLFETGAIARILQIPLDLDFRHRKVIITFLH